MHVLLCCTVESPYNERPRYWQNFFAIMRFHYVEVIFIYVTITWVKSIGHYFILLTLLYRDLLYYEFFKKNSFLYLLI